MGGVVTARLSLAAIICGLGIASATLGDVRPLHFGLPVLAAAVGLGYGSAIRNQVWISAGLFFAAMATNVLSWAIGTGVTGWRFATDGSFILIILFGAGTVWMAARPYMSSLRTRRHAMLGVGGTLCLLLGTTLSDARYPFGGRASSIDVAATAAGLVGVGLLVAATIGVARVAHDLGRKADAFMTLSLTIYATLHVSAMATDSDVVLMLAITTFATANLAAMTAKSAHLFGTPLRADEPHFRVRLWPVVLGSLILGLAHAMVRLDLADGALQVRTFVPGMLSVVVMLFALRELHGPGKPLVLPFGQRDRALQMLPEALLSRNVQLVGQPVQRTSDSKVIGIEARPAWSTNITSVPIDIAAADAGLEPYLDSITLNLAQAHLPAVLASLEGDEPWLSVPLRANTDAAEELTTKGAVDGLVLRVSDAEMARAVDVLRDYGAQVQAPANSASSFDPEIVAVDSDEHSPTAISLRLARASKLDKPINVARVNLVVDDSEPPTNLAAILSRVHPNDDERVRKIGRASF